MAQAAELTELLASVSAESGDSLLSLTEESPVLLLFLRHFGCSFCRQTIEHIAVLDDELARREVRPVFVHLGPSEIAKAHFDYYGLGSVERIHDPQALLYRTPPFSLARTNVFSHFFQPKVLASWFMKGAIFKHGLGKIENDGEQMPGVFFLRDGAIVRSFVHKTIADVPDYLKLIG
jgi:hypothetical protein